MSHSQHMPIRRMSWKWLKTKTGSKITATIASGAPGSSTQRNTALIPVVPKDRDATTPYPIESLYCGSFNKMAPMPVISIRKHEYVGTDHVSESDWAIPAVACLLLILLAFGTTTVFVAEAWAVCSFEIGVYFLTAACLVAMLFGWNSNRILRPEIGWLLYLVPFWGLAQIALHSTASIFETRTEVLRWGSLACVYLLAKLVTHTRAARERMLTGFLVFAVVLAILCLTQLFTSEGKVLWLFPSGYPDVYGTFPYYNNFAQFIELALPIALWRSLRNGWRAWGYPLAGGILFGSVIASASRTGTILCICELVLTMAFGLLRFRHLHSGQSWRQTVALLLQIPVLASAFTLVAGWEHVWDRFQQKDPYFERREFCVAAISMVKERPLTGFGLGTFPQVYQSFAVHDFPTVANHTHNDWAEFAADGGLPMLLLILLPCSAAVPVCLRHPWGLGIPAVTLHALVDYPFPRVAVSGWIFLLLALLSSSRQLDHIARRSILPAGAAQALPTHAST